VICGRLAFRWACKPRHRPLCQRDRIRTVERICSTEGMLVQASMKNAGPRARRIDDRHRARHRFVVMIASQL